MKEVVDFLQANPVQYLATAAEAEDTALTTDIL